MKIGTVHWLSNLRIQANQPGTLIVAINSRAGQFVVFPDEILSLSNEQLLNLIRERVAVLKERRSAVQ